jgi:hypothetical protein
MSLIIAWAVINLAAVLATYKFSVKPQEGVWKA